MINEINFNCMDEKGNIKKYTIIDNFTQNNKNYIIYEEDGQNELYTSLYEIINDKIKIIPIDDDKDYDIVDNYLAGL